MQQLQHRGFIATFLLRWFVCSLGLWVAAGLLRGSVDYQDRLSVVVYSGAVLALLNTLVKPLMVLVSIPAILLTLGIFMLVINGATVYLASRVYPELHIQSFGVAILTGVIIGVINYLVTAILEKKT